MDTFSPIHTNTSPQVLLVYLGMTEPTLMRQFPDGVTVRATYFNVYTRQPERDIQIPLRGPVTLHFAASEKWQGWYYVEYWDSRAKQYQCSCRERRTAGSCHHCDYLENIAA